MKRFWAILLTLAMVLSLLPVTAFAAGSQTLAAWAFPSSGSGTLPQYATTGDTSASVSKKTVPESGISFTSDSSLNSNGWGAGEYWQFAFSTAGYQDIELDFSTRSSGTGPANWKVQCSTDGSVYSDVGTYKATSAQVPQNFSFGTALDNASTAYIRLVVADDVSVNNGTVASTGTNRLQAPVITGETYSGGDPAVNYSVLNAAITAAESLVEDTTVSVDGSDVADNAFWATQADFDTLNAAIETAKGALTSEEQSVVNDAAATLNAASDVFKAARKAGADIVIMTIKEALAHGVDTGVHVVGQLVYRFGNYGGLNSAVLQSYDGDEIYAMQTYTTIDAYSADGTPVEIGDWIVITGSITVYGGVTQMQSLIDIAPAPESLIGKDASAPQEFNTIADIRANYDNLISEYVLLKNVKLGAYSDSATTYVTDSANDTIGIYRAAPYGDYFAEGDVVNLLCVVSKYSSTQQLRNGSTSDYVMTAADTNPPTITVPTLLPAEVGRDYAVNIVCRDYSGLTSVTMEYSIGSEKYSLPMTAGDENAYSAVIPGSQIVSGAAAIELKFVAVDKAATPNTATETASVSIIDQPQILETLPAANSATGSDKRPVVSVSYANAGAAPDVKMTINGNAVTPVVSGDMAVYTPTANMADGKVYVYVKITRADGKFVEREWSFTVGKASYALYFGQLHSHTAEYSDGTGTLEQAFEHAMNAEQIDFLAVTDHSNYFDTTSNLGDMTDPTKGKKTSDGSMTLWQEARATAASYTTDDFIALYGYEMTWSGQYGHMNTFNSVGFESRNAQKYVVKNGPGLIAYYDRLVEIAGMDPEDGGSKTVNQFNHPGTTFGTFEDFAHYSASYDKYITMIEVGNGEGKIGGSMYWPSYEYYTLALDKGWHLAPTNNQDNHKGGWGDSNTARDVIYTDDFSEQGLYQAMRDMSMYSTEDNDLEIVYSLNGNIMGSVLNLELGTEVNIVADFNDPTDRVQSVSLIANGGAVVKKQSFNSNSGSFSFSFTLDSSTDYSYFYIRVDEVDSDIAVTAPVWVKETTKIGITSFDKTNVTVLLNEENEFTTTVYNYESEPYTINKVTYKIGDTVIYTDTNTYTVPADSEFSGISFKYVPTQVGYQTLTVEVSAVYGTTEYNFNASLTFTVRDASTMKTMLIDASHANFYVSGNYADSDTAFIELAAEYGINAQHIGSSKEKVEITDEVLTKCDLLVLTVPFLGADTDVNAYLYSDAEIAAIKRYAERGGNIIITSKSDRRTPLGSDKVAIEEQKASVISNELLEAIGAKARIGDGIVVDTVNMTNETYRLHFVGKQYYNFESMLNDELIETTNTMFSAYNAAPVILNGAEPVVKAFDTSWVSSYYKYFTGSNYAPNPETEKSASYYEACGDQSDVIVMAEETLPGGGLCVTAGVTFFSTFEVKVELENAATLQNSNYQICVNLFRAINPDAVTPIAEIHEKNTEGLTYTIEGYVTSNASGHSTETAFFDCIYVQDASGRGINVFPVSGNYQIGQKVRITGITAYYMGEIELNCGNAYGGKVTDITLPYAERAELVDVDITMSNAQTVATYTIDNSRLQVKLDEQCEGVAANMIEPDKAKAFSGYENPSSYLMSVVSSGDIAAAKHTGNIIEIAGTVTKVEYDSNGVVGAIHVNDGTGTAIVFLDGYIYCECERCNKDSHGYHDLSYAAVGSTIRVRGIASYGQNSYDNPDQLGARIRLRSRSDVMAANYTVSFVIGGNVVATIPVPHYGVITEGIPAIPAEYAGEYMWDIDLTGTVITSDITVGALLWGDADMDGTVSAKDAAMILRHLVELARMTASGERVAKVSGLPAVSAADAAKILRYLVELEDHLNPALD